MFEARIHGDPPQTIFSGSLDECYREIMRRWNEIGTTLPDGIPHVVEVDADGNVIDLDPPVPAFFMNSGLF